MNELPSIHSLNLTVAELQARIDDSPFSVWLGLRAIAVHPQVVEFEVPWRSEFIGTTRLSRVHGGLIAALVDASCGYTLMTRTGRTLSTVDLRIDFHKGAGIGNLRLEGYAVHVGRKLSCADIKVFDENSTLLASGRGVYYTPSEHAGSRKARE
jgi:uncharacterized protein (TIGR00369 family)